MNRINCLIIDHELSAIEMISGKLNRYFDNISISASLQDPEEAIAVLNTSKPDLVFLNVQMPRVDGFNILRRIEKTNFEIIFTTSYNEYAIKAFEFSALKYLLKPIETNQFIQTVEKCVHRLQEKANLKLNNNAFYEALHTNGLKKIAIPTTNGFVIKKVEEIVRIESKDRYAVLFFKDSTNYVSSYNLGKYKNMLSNSSFIQSHKSHIVNKDHIQEYHNSGYLVLSNGDQVPISNSQRKSVIQQIKNF